LTIIIIIRTEIKRFLRRL